MTFYIKYNNYMFNDYESDDNILGEISFKTFYPHTGFNKLMKILEKNNEKLLETIKIFDSTKKEYTIEEFTKYIEKLKFYK